MKTIPWLLKIILPLVLIGTLTNCTSSDDSIDQTIDRIELKNNYTVPRLQILPIESIVSGYKNAQFEWLINDSVVGKESLLPFIAEKTGSYVLRLRVNNKGEIAEFSTTVQVEQEKKAYSKHIAHVYDFLPAVGQFTNELPLYTLGNSAEQMRLKAHQSIVNNTQGMISLGGYGGYVVFGFDHAIVNHPSKRDFKILGNAFWGDMANEERSGSCEPGIVMVAYDRNNNGVPDDDEWYEIAGSEYKNNQTIKNYSLTYFQPNPNKAAVPGTHGWDMDIEYIRWEDNQGQKGFKTKNVFHQQSYFPSWKKDEKLTFNGTKLPDNFYDQSGVGNYWVGKSYAYGYADNAPNNDEASNIDINWAVDKKGNPVYLPAINFIKIYTGVNQEAGWLGEVSTEVMGAYDLHL